jgi:hypoxanthine phosphoribosyltransferase
VSQIQLESFIDEQKIKRRVEELGYEISEHYRSGLADQALLIVPILKGSFVFSADLVRRLKIPVQVDFIEVSSYGAGTESSGTLTWHKKLRSSITDRHVLLIEDIVDTGVTVSSVFEQFKGFNPKSLKLCALLHKPSREKIKVQIDFKGFTIEDRFVVGYGLDFDEHYRELPEIAVVKS